MLNKLLLILSLFVGLNAYAQQDQIVIDGGLGEFDTKGTSVSQVKFGKIGWQEDLWYSLKHRINIGEWLDNRGEGYNNSAFTGYQLGFEVRNDIFEASIWSGPTLITTPDASLGGRFQFNETVFFGLVDKDGNAIGVSYNHFSSAGLEMPNYGKDFMGVEIKFPF